ncbi:MAG: ArsS family sensor histidine kinase [Campylobacter sp.]|nr:ArsS family sensor histidine kinase [Campylobacter sp.]
MRNLPIVRLISVFFVITLGIINFSFYQEYKRQESTAEYLTFQRFMLGMRIREQTDVNITQELLNIGLKNSDIDKTKIRNEGKKILKDSYCDMILYDGKFYFIPRNPMQPKEYFMRIMTVAGINPDVADGNITLENFPVLENLQEISLQGFWILCLTINSVIIVFFIVVLRKLLRLRNLKNMIRKAGEKDNFKMIKIEANDEIGQIAYEFNTTIKKINAIREARTLFLRNILHEFRNPIMKGKIMADVVSELLKDDKFKNQLNLIFTRLEVMLGEVVKVEKLVSNEWDLKKNEHRVIDIIDHAVDLLLLKDTNRIVIDTDDEISVINVDFELYATAVKNLIDNALKYSPDEVIVRVDKTKLCVSSAGDRLEDNRLDFSKAFNRKTELAGSGLGLGLYIANQIFAKHKHKLKYEYKDGRNDFIICF